LLHVCCGPCATYPHQALKDEGHEVAGYFFNPNIHPYSEYQRRLATLWQYAGQSGLRLLPPGDYDLAGYLKAAVENPAKPARCRACYRYRLDRAAAEAAAGGFNAFTTTLLVSPHQDHAVIREEGERAGERYGVRFLYQDFRPGWREGRRLAVEHGLYRQNYCGCVFSEKERCLGG
jgi:hypothetical protein